MAKKGYMVMASALLLLLFSGFTGGGDVPVSSLNATERSFGVSATLLAYPPAPPMELTWKMLTDVQFKDVYVAELDSYYWKPTFGPAVKAMEGKEVFITGYMIPVDYDENFYVISRYPYANCFFCGGGGPESVVDLRLSGKHRVYKTDERLTFKGKLKLNADNIYEMNYILLNAVEYTP